MNETELKPIQLITPDDDRIWETADGVQLPVNDMTDFHVQNADRRVREAISSLGIIHEYANWPEKVIGENGVLALLEWWAKTFKKELKARGLHRLRKRPSMQVQTRLLFISEEGPPLQLLFMPKRLVLKLDEERRH